MPALVSLRAEPLDIELREPFGIATGAQEVARNVLVTAELEDGSIGLGEAAPFPAVSGETQACTLDALATLEDELIGRDVSRWRRTAGELAELLPDKPSARCAVESAVLDAICRSANLPLWTWFGGTEPQLITDITITTGSAKSARSAARKAVEQGFSTLKVKVGGAPIEHDVTRLGAVFDAAPAARWVLDANASMSADQALDLLEALGKLRARIDLFEQPTPAGDLGALGRVRQEGGVRVAADESARSARDVAEIVRERAADVINIKIMKSGVCEAFDMIGAARAHELGLMVGGMVESALAMTISACLGAGVGGFSFVDLDTPLFLRDAPLTGGFAQRGPHIDLRGLGPGHGVARRGAPRAAPAGAAQP